MTMRPDQSLASLLPSPANWHPSWSRWSSILAAILLMALLMFQVRVTQLPLKFLLDWVVNDDTFYYLEIAQRASFGEGFTFDGIHATNGFQPAWGFILDRK